MLLTIRQILIVSRISRLGTLVVKNLCFPRVTFFSQPIDRSYERAMKQAQLENSSWDEGLLAFLEDFSR